MSTKIYAGWKCRTDDLAKELHDLHARRVDVEQATAQAIHAWYAERACTIIDRAHHQGQTAGPMLFDLMHELWDRQQAIKASNRRDPAVDTECKVVLIPIQGHILAYVCAEMEGIKAAATAGMDPFPYWDNTDRPKNTSAAEWEERARLWDQALARDSGNRPFACGPVIEFLPHGGIPDADAVVAALPPLHKRALRLARHVLTEERIGPNQASMTPGQIISLVTSDAFEQDTQERAEAFLATLPTITRASLVGEQ